MPTLHTQFLPRRRLKRVSKQRERARARFVKVVLYCIVCLFVLFTLLLYSLYYTTIIGETRVYRTASHPDGTIEGVEGETLNNLYDSFQRGKRLAGSNAPCLGTRDESRKDAPYLWRSYKEVETLVKRFGSGLVAIDAMPELEFDDPKFPKGRLIGLYSKNRMEWTITDLAGSAYGYTLVPLYDTLGPDSLKYILTQTDLKTVVGSNECLANLLDSIEETPEVKIVVAFEKKADSSLKRKFAAEGVEYYTFSEVVEKGKNDTLPLTPAVREYPNTICFTSGTTGEPKGAILLQHNFVSTCAGSIEGPLSWEGLTITTSDVHISYLPLAHVFERIFLHVCLLQGARVGYYRGDTLKLLDDIRELQPTLFISVPRLYNRINDRVIGQVKQKSAFAQKLFDSALQSKLAHAKESGEFKNWLWDSIVFRKAKKLMGGRVRYMITGGAPLDPVVQANMRAIFASPLLQGYGMTETMAASFISSPLDPDTGHIGAPFPCLEFKLRSVLDMGYDAESNPPKGELCLRGPSVFHGYFRNQEETEAVLDDEGWLSTGDICELRGNGSVRIIDRKKNIFKLAQGEYVAPEKIEGMYQLAPLVGQIFVTGKSTESCLVAMVVADEDQTKLWAQKNKKSGTTVAELKDDPDLHRDIFQQMEESGKQQGLKGFEKVKAIRLCGELFSVENGVLTPTFKIRRKPAYDLFEDEIEEMYEELK